MENYLISIVQYLESFLTKNLLIMIIVMSLILINQPLFWKIRELENTPIDNIVDVKTYLIKLTLSKMLFTICVIISIGMFIFALSKIS